MESNKQFKEQTHIYENTVDVFAYRHMATACGMKFLREFHFAGWRIFFFGTLFLQFEEIDFSCALVDRSIEINQSPTIDGGIVA